MNICHQTTMASSTQRLKEKRIRTSFTSFQLNELESEFKRNMYMFRQNRINVAERLSLRENQIKIWFQNRRMRMKRGNKPLLEKSNKEKLSTQYDLKAQLDIVERLMSNSQDPLELPRNQTRTRMRRKTVGRPTYRALLGSASTTPPKNENFAETSYYAETPDFAKILSYLQAPSSENLPYMISTTAHPIYPYDLDMVLQSITTDLESSGQ